MDINWSLYQAFLDVADAGSLSEAARRTGKSQPTLGRLIRETETRLGARLFDRHPRGLEPTPLGRTLLARAEAMRDAAREIERAASGHDLQQAGTVRVTASEVVAHYLLPPILADLRRDAPEIQIELVPSNTSENLLFREADIAIRMYRPEQLDMVTRHLGDVPIAAYGAKSYLDRRGRPQNLEEAQGHDFVGYDRDERILRGFRSFGAEVTREDFGTRCDDQVVYWQLVVAGCGLGFTSVPIGAAEPRVEPVLTDLTLPSLPVWLTAHEALRHVPRIARVWERLAQGLDPLVS